MALALDPALRRARSHLQAGRAALAADLALALLDRFPANARARALLAEATRPADGAEAARLNAAIAQVTRLLADGRAAAALEAMRLLAAGHGHLPQILDLHGVAALEAGHPGEARQALTRAHRLAPGDAQIATHLALALAEYRDTDAALALVDPVLAADPAAALALMARAKALDMAGRGAEAVATFDRLIALRPDLAEAHGGRAKALASLGQTAAALASLSEARRLAPRHAEFLRLYCNLTRIAPGDPVTAELERRLAAPALAAPDRVSLGFAAGKARHDLGDADAAFAHWEAANDLHHRLHPGDPAAEAAALDHDLALTDRTPLDPAPLACRRPVFLLGMPRSGSTLLEQILASHPAIHGAGERPELAVAAAQLGPEPSQDALLSARARYLDALARATPPLPFVIDKQPLNWRHAGMIRAAFPEAVILHTTRDPRAVTWSLWRRHFPQGFAAMAFAYDFDRLAETAAACARIMAAHRAERPDAVIEVPLATLTADLGATIRPILDRLGLPWDPACALFHENDRAVLTASAQQVRQPLRPETAPDWLPYADRLAPLFDRLAALGLIA